MSCVRSWALSCWRPPAASWARSWVTTMKPSRKTTAVIVARARGRLMASPSAERWPPAPAPGALMAARPVGAHDDIRCRQEAELQPVPVHTRGHEVEETGQCGQPVVHVGRADGREYVGRLEIRAVDQHRRTDVGQGRRRDHTLAVDAHGLGAGQPHLAEQVAHVAGRDEIVGGDVARRHAAGSSRRANETGALSSISPTARRASVSLASSCWTARCCRWSRLGVADLRPQGHDARLELVLRRRVRWPCRAAAAVRSWRSGRVGPGW